MIKLTHLLVLFNNYYITTSNQNKVYTVHIPSVTIDKLKTFLPKYLVAYQEKGICSYYADKFENRTTATGDIFHHSRWTCAHRTIPIPSVVLVLFILNGQIKGVRLLVNDRGPYAKKRVLDVSKTVAHHMGITKIGIKEVKIIMLPVDTIRMINRGTHIAYEKTLSIKEIKKILHRNHIVLVH